LSAASIGREREATTTAVVAKKAATSEALTREAVEKEKNGEI